MEILMRSQVGLVKAAVNIQRSPDGVDACF